jgi:hypothetical protein
MAYNEKNGAFNKEFEEPRRQSIVESINLNKNLDAK